MPDTRRHVHITTEHDVAKSLGRPVVLVDGEPLYGVTSFKIEHDYSDGGTVRAQITLLGVDVDLKAAPDYLVKVVGPGPQASDA